MDVASATNNAPVFARFRNPTGSLSLTAIGTFEPCAAPNQGTAGVGLKIQVAVDGVALGTVAYAHLASVPVTSGPIANGQQIGAMVNGTQTSCWTGRHVHAEPRNTSSFACFQATALGSALNAASVLGVLGGSYASGVNATCPPGATTPGGGGGRAPDGSLIRTPDGSVYHVAGGAPLWITRCTYTNGCAGVVNVPDLGPYASVPADGTLVSNVDDGGIYRFAGGAPEWISSCDYAPTCGGLIVSVDGGTFASLNHMRQYPADGTLISNVRDGGIYRFAGGAPEWISSCSYPPGCGSAITALDGGTFDQHGAISGEQHMRQYPADGTLISNVRDGGIYRFAGGAPEWISSCDYAPGCGAAITTLDGGTFDQHGAISGEQHLRQYPLDGTYIAVQGDAMRRVAGGAALALSDCALLDGRCEGAIGLDGGTLSQHGAISAEEHLREVPADGTVLRGLPSGALWRITGGVASRASGASGGIGVNDSTVAAFIPTPPADGQPTQSAAGASQPTAPALANATSAARLRTSSRTLVRRVRLGSVPAHAKLVLSGRGARIVRWTRLGRGRYRLVVRVSKGAAVVSRDVRVVRGRRTIRVVRNVLRL